MRLQLVYLSRIVIFFFFSLVFGNAVASGKILKMAYKDEAKPPLIGPNGDDSGVYRDMFTLAANQIGYELEIVRLPKKRLYLTLEKGNLDFYPGSSFSIERTKFLVFLSNGLQTKEVLLSRDDHQEVKNLSEITGTLLIDLGGSKKNIHKIYPKLQTYPVSSLDFEQSLTLLKLNRVDYYIADIEEISYYKEKMGLNIFSELGIKVHYDALGGIQPMYMGFSINSPLMIKQKNPSYDHKKPLSYTNTPFTASEESVAYKLHKALMDMRANGDLDKILARYKKP